MGIQKTKILRFYLKLERIYEIAFDRELTLDAASLSFYTIFALIPLLLIFITVLTSMDAFLDIYLEIQKIILTNFLPVNHELIMGYINDFLQNSIELSLFSFGMLFISSLLFFQNYEYIVNNIFKAPQRDFIQSIGIYVLMIIITPISLAIAFSISAYIASAMAMNTYTSEVNILPIIPNIIIWVLFFILFKLSANIKVRFGAAFLSSLIVSIAFTVIKNMFIYYIFLNKSYTTLYGSFSIVLFLFLWTYVSWFIFLHGLRLCNYLNKK
ncbi:MAG: YihY family inner membrane protein [Thiovulaceae bacterium]|jgi:membrane protein|nr:YihY family inner membrane protein [Sulfurimonadaceae bacterium]MCW9026235.1 YihY family inner membrane protein [Sulfurimonadaceae bacterium]